MKKSKFVGAMLCSVCLIAGSAMPAMADSMKVVTLGADLTDAQKNTMMNYFKVDSSQVELLTITNQDERDHLSSYVPIEQIGTRTVSCAYVKPTTSGGIKVRTANLNWVTGNMIATTLSTSGVKNCEVVAACPFEVSGTGALTGVQMAYETASGEQLDSTKKELATQELVVTGNLADQVGKNDATTVINQSKMEVIQNDVQNADEIYNIVVNVAQEYNVNLDSDQMDTIVQLLQQIADQGYNYDDVKDTLQRVEDNVTGESDGSDIEDEAVEDDTVEAGDVTEEDSILDNVDDTVLGEDVIQSSTQDPTLEQQTAPEEDTTDTGIPEAEDDGTIIIDNTDDNVMNEESTDENVMNDEETDEGTMTDEITMDTTEDGVSEGDGSLDTSVLSESDQLLFDQAKTFCTGEYEGDVASLQTAMGADAYASVVLDSQTGAELSKKVEQIYLQILNQGTDSYVPDGTETYLTTELNMLDVQLKELFGITQTADVEDSSLLTDVSQEDKQVLYEDTMKFFGTLYGETTDTAMDTETADIPEATEDEME